MVSEPSHDVRAAAYRVAQEALVNVRKHSRGTSVHVVLEERERGVFVRIEDDGVGFAPEIQSDGGHHLGLTAMRERAELAGGWCRISSVPGEGTIVEFWLPDPQQRPVGMPVVSATG
jgi:signal transduction histidine kinase